MDKLENYYYAYQEQLDRGWEEHLSYLELGSGEDRIEVTDRMFWEFIEDQRDGFMRNIQDNELDNETDGMTLAKQRKELLQTNRS